MNYSGWLFIELWEYIIGNVSLRKKSPVLETFRKHSRILVKYRKMLETCLIIDTKNVITGIGFITLFLSFLSIYCGLNSTII